MKGATLLSHNEALFEVASDYLVELSGVSAGEVAQVTAPDGALFNLFREAGESPWDLYDPPFTPAPGAEAVQLDELRDMTALAAECRSERFFVLVVGGIAARSSDPVWVLDTDGVLWPGQSIDVDKLLL